MNTLKITLLLLVFLLTLQCSVDKKNSNKTIDIEANINNFKGLKLSEIAKEIEYIPLQTDSTNVLDHIQTMDISDKYIFINDGINACFLYDRNGKYLFQIGRKGKGPGEYIFPGNVKISGEHLFIAFRKNVLVYNAFNQFVTRIDVKTELANVAFNDNFIPVSDSLIACHIRNSTGDEKYRVGIYDLKSRAVQSFTNYYTFNLLKPSASGADANAQFYYADNQLSYKERFNDTIFRIENMKGTYKIKPAFNFHLGKYKYPENFRSLEPIKSMNDISNYIWIEDLYETRSRVFMNCSFGNHNPLKTQKRIQINGKKSYVPSVILGVYDKNAQETFFVEPLNPMDEINPNGILNDLDGGMNFFPVSQVNDSTLAMTVNAYDLMEYINSPAFKNSTPLYPEKKKELEKLANGLNENDNPVVIVVKLKEWDVEKWISCCLLFPL